MDSNAISMGAAFAAGLLSFLSPCVLPLVPAYIAYLGGATADEFAKSSATERARTLLHACTFVFGFSMVFIAVWVSLGLVGNNLVYYLNEIRLVGGIVLIIFGLQAIGVFNLPFLLMERRFHLNLNAFRPSLPKSFLIGAVFAAGWTPCIGPTLGAIIGLASQTGTVLAGTYLLIAYSAGMAAPFLLCAVLLDRMLPIMRGMRRHMRLVMSLQGVFLIGVGLLMVFDMFILLPQYFDWGQY